MDTTTSPQNEEIKPIRIMVVDDQEVMRLGLKLGLTDYEDMVIVGEAADGLTAIKVAEEVKPDVVLMDVGLPGLDGVATTQKLKEKITTRVLMLSSHSDEKTIFAAFRAGADGFCLKDASTEKVISAIRSVASGGAWLSEGISENVLRSVRFADPETTNQHASLSKTEMEVLNLIFEGETIDSIAKRLGYSNYDIMVYTNRVLQKVAVNSARTSDNSLDAKERKITGEHKLARFCTKCHEVLSAGQEICPIDGAETVLDSLIGTVFAERYDILALLGSGAGGSVYKARHKFMQKLVAIKILHGDHMSDLDMLRRFRQEAATSSMIQHPNIVSVSDFGFTDDGEPFMIMDYVEGISLASLTERYEYLPPKQAIPIFIQICKALSAAHEHGIIHRDLKPGNVLVSGFGTDNLHVRLADFGIAKLTKPLVDGQLAKTGMGEVFGSPFYMSPEQCMGLDLDVLSDMYSMGCLMYSTLTGIPPAVGKDAMEVMYKKVNDDLLPISQTQVGKSLNRFIQAIVMKTLKFNKFYRFQSFAELEKILVEYQNRSSDFRLSVYSPPTVNA